MDKDRVNIPRSSRRKKEETAYSEDEGDNGTEEERDGRQAVSYHETVYGTADQAAPATNSTVGATI